MKSKDLLSPAVFQNYNWSSFKYLTPNLYLQDTVYQLYWHFFVDCLATFCFFWRLRNHVSLINLIFQCFNFLLPRLWGVGSEKIQRRLYGGTYDRVLNLILSSKVCFYNLKSRVGFPGASMVKNLPAKAGDVGSIPRLGRSPGEGNGNSLQYSCLERSMDRGAWWAIVHRDAKSRTWLEQLNNSKSQGWAHEYMYMCAHMRVHAHTHAPLWESAFTLFKSIQTLSFPRPWELETLASYPFCICVSAGIHCESYKDPCANVSCLNGGTCDSEGLNGTCVCTPGFTGKWPRNWVFELLQNPWDCSCEKNPETSMHTLLQNMNCTAEGKQGSLGRRPVLKQFTVLSLSEALRSAFGSKTCWDCPCYVHFLTCSFETWDMSHYTHTW